MAEDKELQEALEERKRALNPSTFDKGFGEGDDNMGFDDNNDDWGSDRGTGSSDSGFEGGGDSGFGGGFGGGDSGFGGGFGSSGGDSGFGGGGFGGGDSGFGGGGGFGSSGGFGGFSGGGFGGGGFGQQQAPQQDKKEVEDVIFDGLAKGGKTTVETVKKIGTSAKDITIFDICRMGKQGLITGIVLAFIGIILLIAKASIGLQMVIGGLFSAGIGVIVFMCTHDKITKNNMQEPERAVQTEPTKPAISDDSFAPVNNANQGWGNSDDFDTNFDSGFEDSTSDDGGWGNADSWDDDDSGFQDDSSTETSGVGESSAMGYIPDEEEDDLTFGADSKSVADKVLDSITIENGTVTRQYIFEKLCRVLPSSNPNFNKVEELSESSAEFGEWLKFLNNATDVLKPGADSKEARPQLLTVKKKLFYYMLEISIKGVKGIKPDALTEQLVSLYAYDPARNKRNDSIYGTYDSVGGVYYIKIMRGESAVVTAKDIMLVQKDFFLDTKNEMPCALGIDIDGEPVVLDLASCDSLLITGEPRTGKSWCARNILLHMMAFASPEDVNFYIFDPKGGISDYKLIRAPHIKRFETTDETIVSSLRDVVRVEGPRRKKILADAGVYKIQEYHEKFPNNPLPYLYVIIDEVVTLSERMDKETKSEFQSLLTELVTQLPAAGIRLFMIPHVVKDDIIKKTTTQNIPCRISVRGNQEHIELCTGLKPKDFPYQLTNVGDMAVNIKTKSGILQTFVHSAVIATTASETDDSYNFVDAMWRKINNLGDTEYRVSQSMGYGIKKSTVGDVTDTDFAPINLQKKDVEVASNGTSNGVSKGTSSTTNAKQPEGFTYTASDSGLNFENDTATDDDDFPIW